MNKKSSLILAGIFVIGMLAVGAFAMPFAKENSEIKDSLENGNFAEWKEAMTSELTEERFEEMRNEHQKKGQMREQMELAISKGYDSFVELMQEHPHGEKLLETVDEQNFDLFVQMHEARSSGDFELAEDIAEELGLDHLKHQRGLGKGMHKGSCQN